MRAPCGFAAHDRQVSPLGTYTVNSKLSNSERTKARSTIADCGGDFSKNFWPPRGRGGRQEEGDDETFGRRGVRGRETHVQRAFARDEEHRVKKSRRWPRGSIWKTAPRAAAGASSSGRWARSRT